MNHRLTQILLAVLLTLAWASVSRSAPPSDRPLAGKKVAVLVDNEYIHEEIEYYKRRVPELGGELHLLSYLWGNPSKDFVNDIDNPERSVTSVHRLTVDRCVTKSDPDDYDVVICAANYVAVRLREIPPMGSLGSPELTRTAPAVKFFAKAMRNPKIVKGAMCHALWLLTPEAELLRGRRVICHTVVLSDVVNAGAVYVPAPNHVVVDGDLVTARSFADVEGYFEAIVQTVKKVSRLTVDGSEDRSAQDIIHETADQVVTALEARLTEIPPDFSASNRPVARVAKGLLDGTLSLPSEVKRLTGVDFDTRSSVGRKPVLLVASKFGTWASELTLVAESLLKAGYKVKIATEDGSPPHLLGPSLDPSFEDAAWRSSVVSPEEQRLALKFLQPDTVEHALLTPDHIFDLRQLPKPPQAGEYLKDRGTLGIYRKHLIEALKAADQFEALIIAGGSGAVPGYMDDRGLQSLILAFHNLGKPIMGQCNGGLAIAQTVDPTTDRSILWGRAVTTHSWLDEYQSNWGWTKPFAKDTNSFWANGKFDLTAYRAAEEWVSPGLSGNPLIDSEALFKNAVGTYGVFFSPAGSPYSVVVDEKLVTCRTTPDGYPGVLALMAILDGRPALQGRLFIDADEPGRRQPKRPGRTPDRWAGPSPLDAARRGDLEALTRWLAAGGDPDITDQNGWTPLLLAAAHGQAAAVELLLRHNIPNAQRANPDVRFPGSNSLPIFMAGQSGDVATVKALLRDRPGHVFDVATVNGHTVLLQAAFYGQKQHQELAAYLLKNIGDILSIPENEVAATVAARKRLMTATNVMGQDPIALAQAQAYDIRPMVELLKSFACTTEDERTAYYRRLLGRIAPPAPRNSQERQKQALTDRLIDAIQNALKRAAKAGPEGVIQEAGRDDANPLDAIDRLLNEPELEINWLGGPLQRTPLIIACTGADTGDRVKSVRAEIVDRLLKQEADPLIHEVHAMGVNAVARAAVSGHLYLLERFARIRGMTRGAFADALNERPLVSGFTALHDSVLGALSARGQRLDDYLAQIRWLVRHGASSLIEDHTGRTQEAIVRAALDDPAFAENAQKVLDALLGDANRK